MKMKILSAVALACTVTACETTDINGQKTSFSNPNLNSGVAIAMNIVQPFSPSLETKTASSGEVLFTQSATIVHGAKIMTEFKTSSIPLLGVNFKVTPEHILYPALTQKYGRIYCTLGSSGKELFMLDYRTCFRDSDKDEAFDELWMTDESGNGVHRGYASVWASYVSTSKIKEPVNFKKIDSSELPLDKFGVKYSYNKSIFGKESLTFTTVTIDSSGKPDNSEYITVSDRLKLDLKKETFPKTITLGTSKIEIVSFEDKKITYLVKDGYEEGAPVLLGRQRTPVVVYY